jgi:hypothetical protein
VYDSIKKFVMLYMRSLGKRVLRREPEKSFEKLSLIVNEEDAPASEVR